VGEYRNVPAMKNVLMPTYCFYPLNNGGTFRVVKFARYLKDHGWRPIVVAPEWSASQAQESGSLDPSMRGKDPCRVERVGYASLAEMSWGCVHKAWARIRLDVTYPWGTLPHVTLQKCREICARERVDALFASSLPQYVHWVADRLSREFKIPWIADYRDLADQEPIAGGNVAKSSVQWLRRQQIVHRDVRYAQSAAAITTVSEGLAERLRARSRPPVHTVMNGFDPDDFPSSCRVRERNAQFTIMYAGCLFGNRDPGPFLAGIDLLLEQAPELRERLAVVFYGKSSAQIVKYLTQMRHRCVVTLGPVLTHEMAVREICRADVLCLLSHPGKGIATGKIFEYLAAGRPILSVPGDGDITDRILRETNAGVVARAPAEVARVIRLWFSEWQQRGAIGVTAAQEEVYKYTRQNQAGQLAAILNSISRRPV
jgi:glycosyltransferase involved in cell wall biosynthesis